MGRNQATLTPTKTKILALLAGGSTQRAIASRIGTTEANVEYHIRHMQRLLSAPNATALVAIAIVTGVLTTGSLPIDATGLLTIDLDALPRSPMA